MFQNFYLLKWTGYNNRYNSWEPEENLNCDDLVNEFEQSRAIEILGISKRNVEPIYVVKVRDSIEPICVSLSKARIWAKLTFRYWLNKVQFDGFVVNNNFVTPNVLNASQIQQLDQNSVPEIICKKFVYSSHFTSVFS